MKWWEGVLLYHQNVCLYILVNREWAQPESSQEVRDEEEKWEKHW